MPPKPGSKQNVTNLTVPQLKSLAENIAKSVNPDPNFISAILGLIEVESGWRPNVWGFATAQTRRLGGDRAFGLMQLMAGTAGDLGVDRFNLRENILGGAKYLNQQLKRFGNYELAFAAYNSGPGSVSRAGNKVPNKKQTRDHWIVANNDIAKRGGWPDVDASGEPTVVTLRPPFRPPLQPQPQPQPQPVASVPAPVPQAPSVNQALQAQAPLPSGLQGLARPGTPALPGNSPGLPRFTPPPNPPTPSPNAPVAPIATPAGQALLKKMLGGGP